MDNSAPSIKNYKDHLKIDKYALDEEVIKQPSLYAFYAEQYPLALERRDLTKLHMEELYAELDGIIRTGAASSGAKITEKAIEQKILLDKDYADIQREYIVAVAEANNMGIIKMAFEHRKDCIEMLIKLYLSGYFSEVEIRSQEASSKEDEIEKRIADIKRKKQS